MFTLVIAEILRDRFGVSQVIFGGLIVYTLANTLLPGFIDAHAHFPGVGASKEAIDCKAPGMQSINALQEAVRQRAASQPKGTWIRGRGYDQSRLAEQRHSLVPPALDERQPGPLLLDVEQGGEDLVHPGVEEPGDLGGVMPREEEDRRGDRGVRVGLEAPDQASWSSLP